MKMLSSLEEDNFFKMLSALENIESMEDKSLLRILIVSAQKQHDLMTAKKIGGFYPNDKITFKDEYGRKRNGFVVRENRKSVTVRVGSMEYYIHTSNITLLKKAA